MKVSCGDMGYVEMILSKHFIMCIWFLDKNVLGVIISV